MAVYTTAKAKCSDTKRNVFKNCGYNEKMSAFKIVFSLEE